MIGVTCSFVWAHAHLSAFKDPNVACAYTVCVGVLLLLTLKKKSNIGLCVKN